MHCEYYASGRCRSCSWIERPYAAQLADKERHCRALLAPFGDAEWLPAVASTEAGFRNKAKMVVGGSVEAPTLGILDEGGGGIDLSRCPLYPSALQAAFPVAAEFLARARVPPYDIAGRRGEAKYLLATLAGASGELMLRFVLRSTEAVARMRKQLPWLQAALPSLRVASANIQPLPAAVIEGERELVLTDERTLTMQVGGMPLHLGPRSFFQTNTAVASALYAQVREWADEVAPGTLWDLYCGVGGFALACAAPGRHVTGVEASVEAIASAHRTRAELGLEEDAARFVAADATAFARDAGHWPGMVVVNPPRRGIGNELARLLDRPGCRAIAYSSCNAESLARDLAAMPSWRVQRARLLDMFPHTPHHEVLVLLRRS